MGTGRRLPAVVAATAAALLCAAAPAGAVDSPPSTAGGASGDPVPVVKRIKCRADCFNGRAQAGSLLVVKGRELGDVAGVSFLGRKPAGDDVPALPERTSAKRLDVVVPPGAVKGRLAVAYADGTASKPSRVVNIVRPPAPRSNGGPIATIVTGRKIFFGGRRRVTLTYELEAKQPASVVVQVVRQADAAVVASFDQGVVSPGERRSVSWNGRVSGKEPPEGRYSFVAVAQDLATGYRATTAQAPGGSEADSFVLLGHRFPVRGKHDYGEYAASFGGGRGHQGHDVFARCGTPLVAARGGTVKMKRFQSRAGHYIVVDGEQEGTDYAYMHLRDPALVDQGDRVRTGQRIGYVGDTGRAHGCHLHFEMWDAPGWYTGGSPFDPLPHLKAWDAVD